MTILPSVLIKILLNSQVPIIISSFYVCLN